MNRIVLITVITVLISGFINADTINKDKLLSMANTYSDNIKSIDGKLRIINKLRNSRNTFSIPGFTGRHRRENHANRINELQKEIVEIESENSELIKTLNDNYFSMSDEFSPDDIELMKAMDGIKVRSLEKHEFLEKIEISVGMSDKKLEYLKYRRQKQAEILKDVETLINTMKTRKTALRGSNSDYYRTDLEKNLTILDNIRSVGRKSQEMLDKILKTQ